MKAAIETATPGTYVGYYFRRDHFQPYQYNLLIRSRKRCGTSRAFCFT